MGPSLTLNLGCRAQWMANEALNLDRAHLDPPEGIRYYRADPEELDHYLEPGCASEIWARGTLHAIPPERRVAALRLWLGLLVPGGRIYLAGDTPEALIHDAGGRIAGQSGGLLIVQASDLSDRSDMSDRSDPSDQKGDSDAG